MRLVVVAMTSDDGWHDNTKTRASMAKERKSGYEAHPLLSLRARLSRILAPGYGWCRSCGRSWRFVEPHTVQYTATSGAFAICEDCWPQLTVEQRVRHMRRAHGHSGNWPLIETATRAK